VRTAIVSACFAAVAVSSLVVGFVIAAPAGAEANAGSEAIVATGPRAATATALDGSLRVELPWLLPGDTGAAVSPDGRRVAFSSSRGGSSEIYVADARTGGALRLTGNASSDDVEPAWSPDGRRLAWSSGPPGARDIFAMDAADGRGKRRLVGGDGNDVEPAWSPDGTRVAFASNRGGRYRLWVADVGGGGPAALVVEAPGQMRSPDWSPSGGRIAYTGVVGGNADVWLVSDDGTRTVRTTTAAGFDGRPAWSPDGRSIAFVSGRGGGNRIWVMAADGGRGRSLEGSAPGDDTPDWSDVGESILPERGSLLPDLDQQAPSSIVVMHEPGRTRIGFTSAVDSIGAGPIHIRGARVGSARTMRADQLVHARDGSVSVVPGVGRLAYESHPPHFHWHLEPYERYELRRASDGALIGRDGKSGFCLLDRWGHALRRPGIVPGPPRFVGDCASGSPDARHVEQGSSVGYTDRYPAFFHGQDIDITGLRPGLYVLVHRANPLRLIRELRYTNNDSSALIRLSAAHPLTGAPAVRIVRLCSGSDRCPPA
jgi:TolB protein